MSESGASPAAKPPGANETVVVTDVPGEAPSAKPRSVLASSASGRVPGVGATRPAAAKPAEAVSKAAPAAQPSATEATKQTMDKLSSFRDMARAARDRATGDNAAAAKLAKELGEARAHISTLEAELSASRSETDEVRAQLSGTARELESAKADLGRTRKVLESTEIELRIAKAALTGDIQSAIDEVMLELNAIIELPDPTAPAADGSDGVPMEDPFIDHHDAGPAPTDEA